MKPASGTPIAPGSRTVVARCAVCDVVVDLSDDDHHVCVKDHSGRFVKSTARTAGRVRDLRARGLGEAAAAVLEGSEPSEPPKK